MPDTTPKPLLRLMFFDPGLRPLGRDWVGTWSLRTAGVKSPGAVACWGCVRAAALASSLDGPTLTLRDDLGCESSFLERGRRRQVPASKDVLYPLFQPRHHKDRNGRKNQNDSLTNKNPAGCGMRPW